MAKKKFDSDLFRSLKIALAICIFATFVGTLRNQFVFDDDDYILRNQFLRSVDYIPVLLTTSMTEGSGNTSNFYRPIQALTHFIDFNIWGTVPALHHLTNIALQVGMGLALFLFLCRILPQWPAFAVSLLFSIHPMQSECAAYLSGRSDILGLLFVSLTLRFYRPRPGLAVLFAALAVLLKENFVVLPILVYLVDQLEKKPLPIVRHLPYWGVAGIYTLARLTVLNFKNTLNFYEKNNVFTENFLYRFFTYLTTIPKSFLNWFWPYDLHHERSWSVYVEFTDPHVWLSLILVLALLAVAIWQWNRRRIISAGIFWYFVCTLPTSNLLVPINALFYDHWVHFAWIGHNAHTR